MLGWRIRASVVAVVVRCDERWERRMGKWVGRCERGAVVRRREREGEGREGASRRRGGRRKRISSSSGGRGVCVGGCCCCCC